ncbi:MAG: DoxX family protein [Sphingobacteriales bacterium]
MKKTNIIYCIATGILLALMLFSAIGSFMPPNPDGIKMMHAIGYRPYIIQFLAVAKILGIIAILAPGFPRIKEWAYAGFAFDLMGATYSMAVNLPFNQWAPMPIFLVILAVSYIYYHKKLKLKASAAKDATV